MHALFTEDGEMEKRVFLATWKDIPAQNEIQFTLQNVEHSGGKWSPSTWGNSELCRVLITPRLYL